MYDLEYKKHIQFLRALSVIFVFLYHTNISFFSKGYLGVDIFFVISGYVITQRIFQNYIIEKKINLLSFYLKRFKRIIPNLFFIIGITYIFYSIFGPPNLSLWNETISGLFGFSNFYYLFNKKGYFENIFEDPLAHTWSLGVEEQFYLFYPLLIFLIYSLKSNKHLILNIILILIFCFSLFFYKEGIKTNPTFTFFFSPLRFWEFIFGGLLFFYSYKIKKSDFLSIVCLLIIAYLIFNTKSYDFFWLNLSIIILSGFFIVFFDKFTFVENKIFVYFGNISYSFYLWHLPVIFFLDLYVQNIYYIDIVLSFIVTTLLSIFTYHYIEQKFRYINFIEIKKYFYLSTFILGLTFIFLIYAKYFNDNLRNDLKNLKNHSNFLNVKYNWDNRVVFNDLITISGKKVYDHCTEQSIIFTKNKDNLIIECLKQQNYNTLFYIEGDSHTAQFLPIFDKFNSIKNIYFKHQRFYKISTEEVNQLKEKFSEIIYVTSIDNIKKLEQVILSYNKFHDDIKLILFNSTPYPVNQQQPSKCLIQQINCHIDKNADIQKRSLKKLFGEIDNFKTNNKNIYIFDSYGSLCEGNKCTVYDKEKDVLFYRDIRHLVPEGTQTLIPKFRKFIQKLKNEKLIYNY
jgi:peptidoglycan/LPS O-acetylase OafA/YrhL